MCMHFMIWRLHINVTVYQQYPTLAILAHKHLGIDATITSGGRGEEDEGTGIWYAVVESEVNEQN